MRAASLTVMLLGFPWRARPAGATDAGPMPTPAPPPAAAQGGVAAVVSERSKVCPRCGYRCDAAWRYCVRCGWDLRILVGSEAGERLEAITSAVVGVTVTKRGPTLQQMLSPKDYDRIKRYVTWDPGLHKSFATAIPFSRPGIFVTGARSLAWADEIVLRTHTNGEYPAEALGYDVASGIGVIKANVPSVDPLAAADGSQSMEGAWVVCYPIVYEGDLVRYLPVSLHSGRITGAAQSGSYMASFENLLRTDHSIPQGCPGGALIDQRGALAGMVLGSPDTGITYAIPIHDIAPIVERLVRKEKPNWPYFGIGLVVADDRRRALFGINGAPDHPLVGFLAPRSPATDAGVRAGDLLVAVGGEPVATVAGAGARLLAAAPGGPPVTLTLKRGGQEVQTQVNPGTRPSRIVLEPIDELQEGLEANLIEVTSGPTSQQGLRVSDLVRGGRGEGDDYKNGDIIISVNGKGVRRTETLNEIVRSQNPHIFSPAQADGDVFSIYRLTLEVRARGENKEEREYLSRFPDILEPPVY